jgi:hypothetical protein
MTGSLAAVSKEHRHDLLRTDGADELAKGAIDEEQHDQPELDDPEWGQTASSIT